MPQYPGPHAIVVMAIAVAAFFLYTRPRLRMELVALLLLAALVLTFYLFPFNKGSVRISDIDVLSGFGHPVLIAILSLMIMGRGMVSTGALEPAVRWLSRLWKWSPTLGLLLTLLFGVGASAFINDTPVMVMMLPMLLGIAERTGTSVAKTLMPVNFAVLGGGMLTTLGTSTNLLVISIAADLGVDGIGIFDFTSISIAALLVALPYLWLVAPRLLKAGVVQQAMEQHLYEAGFRVAEGSPLAGRTLADAARLLGRKLPVRKAWRGGTPHPVEDSLCMLAGDDLLLRETPEGLREIAAAFAVKYFDADGLGQFIMMDRRRDDEGVVELVIGPKSRLSGATLRETQFAEHFGVVVIGVHRNDADLLRTAADLADAVLQPGDLLLAQGPEPRLAAIRGRWGLMVLDSKQILPRTPLAPWALGIMVSVIAVASLRILPIHVAALLGVVAMLVTGCVKFEGVARSVSLEVVLLVASSIALGLSLVGSGAADWLASGAVTAIKGLPAAVQVGSVMVLAALLTNFVSNSAAAAIGTPIAVTTAQQLGLPAEPFVLAILFGANLSYATPMAYQTNLLIMSIAGYTFRDFLKVGLPLVALMLCALSFLLVRHYGL